MNDLVAFCAYAERMLVTTPLTLRQICADCTLICLNHDDQLSQVDYDKQVAYEVP